MRVYRRYPYGRSRSVLRTGYRLAVDTGGVGRFETAGAESGSAVSIHGPLYSAASGVEADGCGQVAGATALYRLRLEIRFWVGSVPCRPFFGYKARGLLPDGEWAGARGNECRLPGF